MTKLMSASAVILLMGTARAEQWLQRYHDAQHTSFINGTVDPLNRVTFRYTFDTNTSALIHFTDPKIESNGDLFVPHRERNGSVITYGVRRLSNGDEVWSFTSDYVRQPSGAWEPVFDFALNNGIVYVMARYGCLWRLNGSDGGTDLGRIAFRHRRKRQRVLDDSVQFRSDRLIPGQAGSERDRYRLGFGEPGWQRSGRCEQLRPGNFGRQ